MGMFQQSVVNKYLNGIDRNKVKLEYEKFKKIFCDSQNIENIKKVKEEQYQEGFLNDLFVNCLGYSCLYPKTKYDILTELKNNTDSKKADGSIIKDNEVIAVIELKQYSVQDLKEASNQAFGYKFNHPKSKYVIVSNFDSLRFYVESSDNFELFSLFNMDYKTFERLYLILSKESIFNDIPLKMKSDSKLHDEDVSEKLYKDYHRFKMNIYQSMIKNNPEINKINLLKKSQKLLDRLLFILFAEDRGLLEPNTIKRIIEENKELSDRGREEALYETYKIYFKYIDQGNEKLKIPQYNGGLFAYDEILDKIKIDNEVLKDDAEKLSAYDFNTDVDVNILGHIFENSLNDIDELHAEVNGEEFDKTKTKRKKDGVFYTPKYITKYIVDNTIGELCNEKKKELNLINIELDLDKDYKRLSKEKQILLENLNKYREYLQSLKILDPACGSGAFLNQALEFLIEEHDFIDKYRRPLESDGLGMFDIKSSILENNLYGVDINEESVELARLSLWLRTAENGRKLNNLSKNIKCGNSLIDDESVAGELAFKWEEEFPEIMKSGGFDVVIGNPPYGILIDNIFQNYYNLNFPLTRYKTNLYILFIERMFQIFKKGLISFIIPKSLLFNTYYSDIRKYILINSKIIEIFGITEKIFQDAEVGGSLIILFDIVKKSSSENMIKLISTDTYNNYIERKCIINLVNQNNFLNNANHEISIVSSDKNSIIDKLSNFKPISDFYLLKNGLNPGNIKHILISRENKSEKHKKIIWGKDITRFYIEWSGDYINYDNSIIDKLTINDIKSKDGMNKQNKIDFALRTPEIFENEKLLVRKTGDSLISVIDNNNYYYDTLVHGILLKDNNYSLKSLLVILNSKPATAFYRLLHDIKGKVFAKISLDNLAQFPIPTITPEHAPLLSGKADKMLELNKSLNTKKEKFLNRVRTAFADVKITGNLENFYESDFTAFVKELAKQKINLSLKQQDEWDDYFNEYKKELTGIKAEIDRTDKEIDKMVYELYGLTEEEIKIVEGDI